jgi:hypothetical protein
MERRKALGLFAATAASFTALPSLGAGTSLGEDVTGQGKGGYTFALDKNVKRTSVRFKNRRANSLA